MNDKYPFYGGMPPHNETDTSIAAAEYIEPKAGTVRAVVLDIIRQAGPYDKFHKIGGQTCGEVEIALDRCSGTITARIRELVLDGLVRDSKGRRRSRHGRPAAVYESIAVQKELFDG